MKTKTIGVTFGKYIPFHMGHESIIRKMYSDRLDEIIVCVYDCPEYGIDTKTRVKWIEKIFSHIENIRVIEFKDSPQETGYTEDIMKTQEDYFESEMIKNGIDPYSITHLYTSEDYGVHMSERFNCKNVRVDINRDDVDISATEIRNNGTKTFKFLHPVVQKDMPIMITLLGGESTGKTTLGVALRDNLGFGYIPEYGAEYWAKNNTNGKLSAVDLAHIITFHDKKRKEITIMASHNVYIEDTNGITTFLFGQEYGIRECDEEIPEFILGICRDTTLYVICGDEIPFDDSDGRISDEVRKKFNMKYKDYLTKANLPFIEVSGSVGERMTQVNDAINKLKRRN